MPRRHHLEPGNWESVIRRLEELVLANSGEDEFQEIYKLLIAKLFAELNPKSPAFESLPTAAGTSERIDVLLALAASRWAGVLAESRSRLAPEHLAVCVGALQNFSISDSTLEVLDALFEHLISRAAKGAKGQYFTPRHVIECCVRILDPGPDELIADPACGSGGFLIHALRHVQQRNPGADLRKYCASNVYGFDFDARAVQVAKALMLVAGDGSSNIMRLNSLLSTRAAEQASIPSLHPEDSMTIEDVMRVHARGGPGFDAILTNPPFAGEVQEKHLLNGYRLARENSHNERDVLFLERCVQLLRPGGRLAIVLPHNKFGSQSFAYVRDWLLQNVQVVAVLGLHRNTFQPHTAQKASVLFARKRERPVRRLPDEPVFFALSENAGKDSRGAETNRENTTTETPAWDRLAHDLDDVVAAFWRHAATTGVPWRGNG